MRILFVAALLSSSLAFAQAPPPGAPAEPEPPDVSKLPFTAKAIQLVMAYHQPKIQTCYEDFLREKEKAVEGRLLTAFTVTAEGFVKGPRVDRKKSTLKDAKLHECVVAVLASIEFPKPPKGKEQPIEFPFNLKAIK